MWGGGGLLFSSQELKVALWYVQHAATIMALVFAIVCLYMFLSIRSFILFYFLIELP